MYGGTWFDDIRRVWYISCNICGASKRRPTQSPPSTDSLVPEATALLASLAHRRTCAAALKHGWKLDSRGGKRDSLRT